MKMYHTVYWRFRAVRRAAPKQAHMAMCLPVNPASIAVPLGDRPAYSLGEGPLLLGFQEFGLRSEPAFHMPLGRARLLVEQTRCQCPGRLEQRGVLL